MVFPAAPAYERGRKSSTLANVEQLLDSAGFELTTGAKVTYRELPLRGGRPVFVTDRLWRPSIRDAVAEAALPLELNWSGPATAFQLSDRNHGHAAARLPAGILRYVDGALLVDLWPDLVLPREILDAW